MKAYDINPFLIVRRPSLLMPTMAAGIPRILRFSPSRDHNHHGHIVVLGLFTAYDGSYVVHRHVPHAETDGDALPMPVLRSLKAVLA